MTITTKQSVSQIVNNDLVSPTIANQPHLDLEDNVDYLYAYIDNSVLYYFDNRINLTAGLIFYFESGVYRYGNVNNVIAPGNISVTASSTNYMEIDVDTNTVVVNTTGFTNNNIPLWKITTDVSTMTAVADKRSMLYALPQKLTTTDSPTFADLNVANLSVSTDLIINGDLTVNGTTTTVNSTVTTVDDVIMTLGGDTAPVVDDNKDRGMEFRWHDGVGAKTGFFGYDDSISKFTFIPDGSNSSEVYSGDAGDVLFRTIQSNVATGIAPFTVASTTLVTNLNADRLDGQHGSYYEPADGTILKDADIGSTVQAYDADIPTSVVSQSEAETGTATTNRTWTAERVSQAISAQGVPLDSPNFTGSPTAPTTGVGTSSTAIATTAYVNAEIANDIPSVLRVKAWVSFVGDATPTVIGAYNVSSITYIGTGIFRVNFSSGIGSTNYTTVATASHTTPKICGIGARTTSAVTISVRNTGDTYVNCDVVDVVVFGA